MKQARHLSMIRGFQIADWITLGNAACGVSAVFAVMHYLQSQNIVHLLIACALIPLAFALDVLDGRVARWRQRTSALGGDLDSLSDVLSFGLAPAAIAYGAGMNGLWDQVILVFFVVCGVSRLARYNITAETLSQGSDKVKYFEGAPIPSSMLLVVIMGIAALQGAVGDQLWLGVIHVGPWQLHPLTLMFAVFGSLMISRTLHIPKL